MAVPTVPSTGLWVAGKTYRRMNTTGNGVITSLQIRLTDNTCHSTIVVWIQLLARPGGPTPTPISFSASAASAC